MHKRYGITWYLGNVKKYADQANEIGMIWLKAEGNEAVTNCHGVKLRAADGKMRMTDVAAAEQMFRVIQSIPSPKAEPFKMWIERRTG
jgi:hypothetical protein